jgi:hypothetical protein
LTTLTSLFVKRDIEEERCGKYTLCIKVVLWWKRAMPRQARLYAPGTLHHVMIREIKGKRIFRDIQERKDVVTRLGDLSEQTGTRGKMGDAH